MSVLQYVLLYFIISAFVSMKIAKLFDCAGDLIAEKGMAGRDEFFDTIQNRVNDHWGPEHDVIMLWFLEHALFVEIAMGLLWPVVLVLWALGKVR